MPPTRRHRVPAAGVRGHGRIGIRQNDPPSGLEEDIGRQWIGAIHGLLLDCPDEVRRERIEARPRWRLRDVAEQIRWGQWLRENIAEQVDTSRCSPEEAAQAVADWVDALLLADEMAGEPTG